MQSAVFLDIRTLSILAVFVALLFGVALHAFSRVNAGMAGIGRIGSGLLSMGSGFALIAGRDVLPNWLSVMAANLLVVLAWILIYEGLVAFRAMRPRWRWLGAAAFAVVAVTFYYHLYVVPSIQARIVWIMLATTPLLAAIVAAALRREHGERTSIGQWVIAVPVALLIVSGLMRVFASAGAPEVASLFHLGTIHALTFLNYIVVVVCLACGSLWLACNRLEERLNFESRTDPLTGALNRRAMNEISLAEVSRAQRNGLPVSVLIADLDNFKMVNDTHGHLVGDEVLRQFAALLGANVRSHDTLVRYGGEEFLLLLPETDRDRAVATAEKLRARTAEQVFHVDQLRLRLKVSFGIATLESGSDDWDHLLRRADAALYAAKQAGRNRVSCAWNLPAARAPTPAPAAD